LGKFETFGAFYIKNHQKSSSKYLNLGWGFEPIIIQNFEDSSFRIINLSPLSKSRHYLVHFKMKVS
jgi:hypothetical protein